MKGCPAQGDVRCHGEAPHIGEERLAGQPTADGPSCGHEPVGEQNLKDLKSQKILKKYDKIFNYKD